MPLLTTIVPTLLSMVSMKDLGKSNVTALFYDGDIVSSIEEIIKYLRFHQVNVAKHCAIVTDIAAHPVEYS
jgi:hypothetical protein